METISISRLKAHLSGELKKVREGEKLIILDHNHPVAEIHPLTTDESLFIKEAEKKYEYRELIPILQEDIMPVLEEERSDRW